eukprot:Nitzschia sp. Nitz4//scaffold70_size99833//49162//52194//NITZ4_004596-RA/size99833-snap-gene-0.144-mRNA-1//-1//CDS//3329557138//2514//frame0
MGCRDSSVRLSRLRRLESGRLDLRLGDVAVGGENAPNQTGNYAFEHLSPSIFAMPNVIDILDSSSEDGDQSSSSGQVARSSKALVLVLSDSSDDEPFRIPSRQANGNLKTPPKTAPSARGRPCDDSSSSIEVLNVVPPKHSSSRNSAATQRTHRPKRRRSSSGPQQPSGGPRARVMHPAKSRSRTSANQNTKSPNRPLNAKFDRPKRSPPNVTSYREPASSDISDSSFFSSDSSTSTDSTNVPLARVMKPSRGTFDFVKCLATRYGIAVDMSRRTKPMTYEEFVSIRNRHLQGLPPLPPSSSPPRNRQSRYALSSKGTSGVDDATSNESSSDDSSIEVVRVASKARAFPSPVASRQSPIGRGSQQASSGRKLDHKGRQAIEDAIRKTRNDRKEERLTMFRDLIRQKNTMLAGQQPTSKVLFGSLPKAFNEALPSSYVHERDYPLPKDDQFTMTLRSNFLPWGKDSKKHALDEGDFEEESSDDLSESKIEEFQDPDLVASGYELADISGDVFQALTTLSKQDYRMDEVQEYMGSLLRLKPESIEKHWREFLDRDKKTESRKYESKYENVMGTFRLLFCRRCFVFDCSIHGNSEADTPPDTQLEYGLFLDKAGFWEDFKRNPFCLPVTKSYDSNVESVDEANDAVIFSARQIELAKRLYKMLDGDLDAVASAMGVSKNAIHWNVSLQKHERIFSDEVLSKHQRQKQTKANTYNPSMVKRLERATTRNFFEPCVHSGLCSTKNCSCIKNAHFCVKACIWGGSSRNFFRGCNCTQKCNTKNCPCFAANRECDPDLCKSCGACTDQPNNPATVQKCRNDNIGMRRHTHLLLGKSPLHGWGLFNKYKLEKGDFIHEYVGETVANIEAERRGIECDAENKTYIFDLTTDYAIDALRQGNKTRYINHSDNPNIVPKYIVVNGDVRIGFFALKTIPAQSELLFDYGDKFFEGKEGRFGKNSKKGSRKSA